MHFIILIHCGMQVAGYVAALRVFFHYGLTNKSHLGSTSKNLNFAESSKSKSSRYKPPHLRKKLLENIQLKDEESLLSSHHELSLSSDSDCSDNDGPATDACNHHFAKARLGAIVCIQVSWLLLVSQSKLLSCFMKLSKCFDILYDQP